MPVYWINLDRATKRKDLFISENYQYFKTITRVSAIDGANLQKTVKHNSHFQLSPAEIATAFSHLIAIETAFKDNCEYALILEDDNSVKPIITNSIDLDAIPNTIKDWDVLQLLTSKPHVLKIFSEIINGNKFDDPYYQPVSDLWFPWKHWFNSAGAYIINRSSMKILVDTYLENGCMNLRDHLYPVADIIVFDRFRTYTSIYTMFEEFDDNVSQIHPEHTPLHRIGKEIVRHTKVPEKIPRVNLSVDIHKEKITKVCFKSFWNGFPLDEQEFIANLCFEDFQVVQNITDADCVISGVFSNDIFKDKKWIHMSGEPFIIPHQNQNLVISSYKIENQVYYPFGLHWLYYEKLVPNLLEHRLVTNVPKKFCCFISSSVHPVVERKFFYDILSKYKNIDSWGSHNNNMGSKLSYSFSSPQFREFLSGYKFIISFENCSKPGYITEKLFNPLLSNIIPIYWGSQDALKYINKDRIIYLEDMSEKSVKGAINEIIRLDNDDEAYLKTVNSPTVVDKNDPLWDIAKTQKYIRRAVKQRLESSNISLYDHIFVVNLDSRKDRLESITNELVGYKWERFSAVRSHEVPDWFLVLNKDNEYRKGSYGCMMSHYNIIKLAKERNYKRVLILEDDTGFKNSIDILHKAADQLNRKNLKWGLLYLSGNHMQPTIRIDDNVVKCVKTYTTNSYIVDSSIYDMILDELQRWPAEIDVFYSNIVQKRVNCYCTSPHVTYQKSGRSDILNKNVVYEGIHMIDP
jgi:GR25 family glycosyltransferase involved in LPS biosynthesis